MVALSSFLYPLSTMKAALSIIIPTHHRPEVLARCLARIEAQTIVDQIEVIVVHDGRDAKETEQVVNRTWRMPITYLAIDKSQQGAARNRGVQLASAPIVLFIGDDAFLEPDACALHVSAHSTSDTPSPASIAVLGFTTWDPAVGITPVMHWLERSGWQFKYAALASSAGKAVPRAIQHRFTYTIHLSLPTACAKTHPFREDVTLYGWEDIEWGLRLAAADIPLIYIPEAKALHHHHMMLEDSLRRMETLGKSVCVFASIAPDFDRAPRGWKRLAYEIAALLPTMAGKHRKAFLKGIKSRKKE